jgi:hypothetical protein
MSNKFDYPIPPGFTWSHARDTYTDSDGGTGRTWDSRTNIMRDAQGCELKTSIDLPFSPKDLIPIPGVVGSNGVTSQESVEQMIQRKGLNAPRVTPADIEAAIQKVEFQRLDGTLMVCVVTLKNGFKVTGESACASPANFNQEVGERVSRENAVRKIWPLLGYALREKLSTATEQQT